MKNILDFIKNNWIYILIIGIVLLSIFKYTIEKFENNQEIINTIKNNIDKISDDDINNILQKFNETMNKPLDERLEHFKVLLKGIINESHIDTLYFNLRMNRSDDLRNKIIAFHLAFTQIKKDNDIDDTKSQEILNDIINIIQQ